MRFGLFAALGLLFLIPVSVFAQTIGGSAGTSPFTISITPDYPTPGGTATLSFLSSSFNLAAATMTISVAGKQTYSGSVQPVSITLGGSGQIIAATVKITYSGITYTQSVNIQPEEVSLVAEPVSSSPALYPGKSLVPLGGNTRIVAVANFKDAKGKAIDPSTLSYAWTVDGSRIAASSGLGKTATMVASPLQYRSRAISVLVSSVAGTLVGSASLNISPVEPTARLYENDPLLGVRFDHTLSGSYTIQGTESSLYATAFSLPMSSGEPVFQWFLNGSAAQSGPVITLRPTGTGQGTAKLSLTASGGSGDEAISNLSLIFGSGGSSNIFGL